MENKTIFYTDINGNYYIDPNNSYYIAMIPIKNKKLRPHIYYNGKFRAVGTYIQKVTNLGPIPETALMTNAGVPLLTKSKEFIITTSASAAMAQAMNSNLEIPNGTLITSDGLPFLTSANKFFLVENGTSNNGDYILYEWTKYKPRILVK